MSERDDNTTGAATAARTEARAAAPFAVPLPDASFFGAVLANAERWPPEIPEGHALAAALRTLDAACRRMTGAAGDARLAALPVMDPAGDVDAADLAAIRAARLAFVNVARDCSRLLLGAAGAVGALPLGEDARPEFAARAGRLRASVAALLSEAAGEARRLACEEAARLA